MMTFSRRELAALLPALAVRAAAQQTQAPAVLPAKVYHHAQIPYTGTDEKKGRRFFLGTTQTGFNIETHETILGAGMDTHPPHKHEHPEMLIIVSGTLEVHMEDKSETAEAGSIVYFSSNILHNARNPGTTPCRYYVIELRGAAA
jgi:mannose-6-phosphate isomerase-like protein (cupin superfamily)